MQVAHKFSFYLSVLVEERSKRSRSCDARCTSYFTPS